MAEAPETVDATPTNTPAPMVHTFLIADVRGYTRLTLERGDEVRYRIRCPWKGGEESGQPGPYAPDIDDGIKINIRPFREVGLLAVKEVIKKW